MIFRAANLAFLVAGLFIALASALGQTTADYAVQVSAAVQSTPAQIALSWAPDPQATSYIVYRKSPDALSWGTGITLAGVASNYVDTNVLVGSPYEYRVHKNATAGSTGFSGEGYIEAGIQLPLVDFRGKVILLVDNTFTSILAMELARLQQDLVGDGWTVLRHDVSPATSVPEVKALVMADYNVDPANVKSVFLFGHLPVPYSGNVAPDGHPDHVGAWPADVYYGDVSGAWTDSSISNTGAADPRNWNLPGDGKFDQSTLPADVKLQVGRVDLSKLPCFAQSETELLRQYLNKDHNFRSGMIQAQRRGVVSDHFGVFNGEAFAANGPRNFAPFFGPAGITNIPGWQDSLSIQSALWGYGCGPGWYAGASGVTASSILASCDPQVVFTMLFGSYFGDWDSPDNLLRSALATPTYTLTSAWAGRPCWQFHPMAMGETIGFCTRLSQNNSVAYLGGQRTRGVHAALMGDPTLRMHPVTPPLALFVATNSSGRVNLRWLPSSDDVVGYHVYRGPSFNGPFVRVTPTWLNGTNFTEISANSASTYMVRAVKLETSGSGTYYNASQGVFATAGGNLLGAAPRLKLTAIAPTSVLIAGQGEPGQSYEIQANDPGLGTNWKSLATVTADSSGFLSFVDSCTATQRLYRTVAHVSSP